MTGANPGAQTAVSARQVGGGGQSVSTVPIPNMAATCPSILEEVTKFNLDGEPCAKALCPPGYSAAFWGHLTSLS